MSTIEVGGLRVAYERVGSGPPLVLLHGFVGDGPATWRQQLDGLSDEFTVIAWDAPGAGASSDPSESIGMAGYADCLAEFVAGLRLGHPHVAGLSFGGSLALEFYRRHPTVPATLTLVSGYAGWAGSLPATEVDQRLRISLGLSTSAPEKIVDALLPAMFSAGTPPEVAAGFGLAMSRFHPVGFRAMTRASVEDLRDVLPLVAVPTLVVCGGKDVRAPRPVAEHLHASIPGSTLVVLPDAGHVCNLEQPTEFNAAVRRFLRQADRGVTAPADRPPDGPRGAV
jgi:pimeloyl-ACP methyl ester carboxylesterase